MRLYHLSRQKSPELDLIPRVPSRRLIGENKTAKRICVAPSIDQAIMGLWGSDDKRIWISQEVDHGPDNPCQEIWPVTKSVYIVDAEPTKPRKLPDAAITGELWLMEPTTMYYEGEIVYYTHIPPAPDPMQIYWYWGKYGTS